ncbi:hypothetical protein JR338_12205 [Chloroflexota bacterium]|nr:hypothetical protein JR338_12205 [Chloroflexota bacterium]
MALPQIISNTFGPQLKTIPGLRSRSISGKRMKTRGQQAGLATVNALMESLEPVPQHVVLLGRCQDGLPFLMSLGDPELGAILIGCERGFGKTHHLQVLVDSAIQSHSPRDLQVAVLTLNSAEWSRFADQTISGKYLLGMAAWYDPQAEQLIKNLTELAESRRVGQRRGPDVLLALDDLPALHDMSWEAQVNLRWLLEYGSQSGVWLVATVNAEDASDLRYWIDTFRTRIVGQVGDENAAEILSQQAGTSLADLAPGEFKAWTGTGWIRYTLPLLGKVNMLEG